MSNETYNQLLDFTKLPTESGSIDEYEYLIRSSWVCTCAYVKIPKGHPWFNKKANGAFDSPDIPVNWGCTFYKYFEKPEEEFNKGCYIGWDYGHIEDNGVELKRERVIEDIHRVINIMKGE